MVRFPCPYCRHLLQAQPSRKGLQRRCPRCQGKFLEPTDPLPGVAPDALIQTEDEDGPEVEIEEPVSDQAVEPTVSTSSEDVPTPTEVTEPTEVAEPSEATEPVDANEPIKSALHEFDTRQLLQPLEELEVRGLLIAWTQNRSEGLKIGTTSGCPKDESEKFLLKAALQLIKSRSTDLHATVSRELARLEMARQTERDA